MSESSASQTSTYGGNDLGYTENDDGSVVPPVVPLQLLTSEGLGSLLLPYAFNRLYIVS